jgi:hypothetical protein
LITHPSHEAHRTRLPYVAAAAAAVLGALYFVPSASATAEHMPTTVSPASVHKTTADTAATTATGTGTGTAGQQLANTGSVNTTPYLIGGTGFLGVGAALVINASRRARQDPAV